MGRGKLGAGRKLAGESRPAGRSGLKVVGWEKFFNNSIVQVVVIVVVVEVVVAELRGSRGRNIGGGGGGGGGEGGEEIFK